MTRTPDDLPPIGDEHDELARMQRFRHPVRAALALLAALLALAAIVTTREGWIYALRARRPVDLGRIEDAVARGRLEDRTYVTFTGVPFAGSEAASSQPDAAPGCVATGTRRQHFHLVSGTGDRVVVRDRRDLPELDVHPRQRYTGRLVRFAHLPGAFKTYRRFVYRLSDCRFRPQECDRRLTLGTELVLDSLLPQLGKAVATVSTRSGHTLQLATTTPIYVMFRHPGEWELELTGMSEVKARQWVKALGVAWFHLGSTADEHHFILQGQPAVAERLIREQRKGSAHSIVPRVSAYFTERRFVRVQGDQMVFSQVQRGFPERYVPGKDGAETDLGTLVEQKPTGTLEVPLAQVTGGAYQGPRELREDAWLLVMGEAPGRAWAALLVAALAMLTLLASLVLAALSLRRPRGVAPRSEGRGH
jgi:hypothetical protein